MGSVMSAIRDDEDEWADLKRKAGITDVTWPPYSPQAEAAKKLFREEQLTGRLLKLKVQHTIEQRLMLARHAQEVDELMAAEKLMAKIDKG